MTEVWTFLIQNFRLVRIRDILDILIVAFVIFGVIKLVMETRAAQLVKGIIALVVAAQLADSLSGFSCWFSPRAYSINCAPTSPLLSIYIRTPSYFPAIRSITRQRSAFPPSFVLSASRIYIVPSGPVALSVSGK